MSKIEKISIIEYQIPWRDLCTTWFSRMMFCDDKYSDGNNNKYFMYVVMNPSDVCFEVINAGNAKVVFGTFCDASKMNFLFKYYTK